MKFYMKIVYYKKFKTALKCKTVYFSQIEDISSKNFSYV